MTKATVVQLSLATLGVLIVTAAVSVAVVSLTIAYTNQHPAPDVVTITRVTTPEGVDMNLPAGAAKEAALKAAYGEVNQTKLNEVKQGWFFNRSRTVAPVQRAKYTTPARSQPRPVVSAPVAVQTPVAVPSASRPSCPSCVAQPVTPCPYCNCPNCLNCNCPNCPCPACNANKSPRPYLLPTATPQPVVVSEPYEIDPTTYRDGSYELRRSASPSCPTGTCPLTNAKQ